MNRRILITGCSGGGKSTLIDELNQLGYATIAEPGRRIVAQEKENNGSGLPWVNFEKFARYAFEIAYQDFEKTKSFKGDVFFDRGLVDAAVALELATGTSLIKTLRTVPRYYPTVFVAPPWPEIFEQDEDRPHDLDAAVNEFDRISTALHELSYNPVALPKTPVQHRTAFILNYLNR